MRLPLRLAIALTATAGAYALARRAGTPLGFRAVARLLLADELGASLTRVLDAADAGYAGLAPKVAMARTPGGRMEVRTSAYLLALYRALREEGIAEERAMTVLSDALFRVMRVVWRVPEAIAALAAARYPTRRRARVQVRLARLLVFREPDWVMREAPVGVGYGVDVTRCVPRDFFASEGAERLCDEVMCRQDERMAEARGVPFMRTGTLARGDGRCDFRFG